MTDAEQLARVAAVRARRGQPNVNLATDAVAANGVAPIRGAMSGSSARRKRRHVAAGARIVVAGAAVSGMFAVTAILAEANRPGKSKPAAVVVPATTAPYPTDPRSSTVEPASAPVVETIVLVMPPLPVADAAVAAGSSGVVDSPPTAAPRTAPAAAPVAATPAPAKVAPAKAAANTRPPSPAATTKPSGG